MGAKPVLRALFRAAQLAGAGAVVALVLAGAGNGAAGKQPTHQLLCTLPPGQTTLPASRTRGLIQHLQRYPTLSLATPTQHRAAEGLLAQIRTVAERLHDPRSADRAGYSTQTAPRKAGDLSAHYLHAEQRHERHGPAFDPLHPKALIFVNQPGRPLTLVGAMYSMRRGVRGPTPGGPITRWHSHTVCAKGIKRGLKPLPSGNCPPGARRLQGSEMLHVWFTRDLRSAFAISAPEAELCRDGLVVGEWCNHVGARRGM